MTDMELKIVKALLETEQGKKFAKNWKWKRRDIGYNAKYGVCEFQTKEDKGDDYNYEDDDFTDFVPLLTELQMLDAIMESEDCIDCTLTKRLVFFVQRNGWETKYLFDKVPRREAIQRAFLEIVLGVEE